jgi:N-acetylglucosamine-6-phosphate deacetylase
MKESVFARKIYTGNTVYENSYMLVEDGIIAGFSLEEPQADKYLNLRSQCIGPLMVDLQIYGGGGQLFNTKPTAATIAKTYAEIRPGGTGYFQITLSTTPPETMRKAIDACKNYWAAGGEGLLGLHLEGPFFNPAKRGAHVAKYVRKPSIKELKTLLEYGKGVITYMTIAPEMFDTECLTMLVDSGIALAAGHSNATYAQAQEAFKKGISRATHLYNAMSQFESRAPGMVGACFDSNVRASIVCDGVHVDYAAVKIAKKLMGQRLFYITDAVTEDIDGEYAFRKKDNYYVNLENTLSGSALSMWQAVQNGVQYCQIPLEESLRMATAYPAKVIDKEGVLGYLLPGFAAKYFVFELIDQNQS